MAHQGVNLIPPTRSGRRIEWTGAGGGQYLAIVVNEACDVIAECWGNRKQVRAWMKKCWPELPVNFVPMAQNTARAGR
jgi:hypothetical protein